MTQLMSLLAVQLGEEHPDLLLAVKQPLLQLGQDPTASPAERVAVSHWRKREREVFICGVCFITESVSSRTVCLHPGIRLSGKSLV